MNLRSRVLIGAAASLLVAAAVVSPLRVNGQAAASVTAVYTLPDLPIADVQNAVLKDSIDNDRKLLLGGIGSDLWHGATDAADEFWMITDRGPNGQIKVDDKNRRTFPIPGFTPLILHVKVADEQINILETLPLVNNAGAPITGMSNLAGHDEVPWDFSAQTQLEYNADGLDSEGLVRTSQGDFWLADEYSPSIIHVDATGKVIRRYVPFGLAHTKTNYPVVAALPAIYGARQSNRGFEGIAISADEKTLYIVLQSPLSVPDKDTSAVSRQTRVLVFDIATEKVTAEYVYEFQPSTEFGAETTPDAMKLSAVIALNETTLIILERTDDIAKLYLADFSAATNILGTEWDDVATTPSLEQATDLATTSVTPLAKTLLLDLSTLTETPKKIEGVTLLDKETIVIANDNDFDIGDFDADGNNVGKDTKSKILVIKLAQPLP